MPVWARTGMEQTIKLMCEVEVRQMHLPAFLPRKNVPVVEMESANFSQHTFWFSSMTFSAALQPKRILLVKASKGGKS